jgi:hypothetical protein
MRLDEITDPAASANLIKSFDEVLSLLNGHYSENWKHYMHNRSLKIYRGIRRYSEPYFEIKGGSVNRKSAGLTSNVYTTLFSEHLKSWSKYPKRNKSIIGATDIKIAKSYAEMIYVVIPKNGAKIGVCSDADLWTSFPAGFESLYKTQPLVNIVKNNASSFPSIDDNLTLSYKLYSGDHLADLERKLNDLVKRSGLTIEEILQLKSDTGLTLYHTLNSCLSPESNGFSLVNSVKDIEYGKEVWTDDDCLLINTRDLENIIVEYNENK